MKSAGTPSQELEAIRKRLGYLTFELPVRHWLDTGSGRLNSVLGSEEKGLAYGKMIELSGQNANGKTLLGLFLASLAQQDGATVGWMDTENSMDLSWARAQGIDTERIYVFYPKIGTFGKEKGTRLQTAEELCTEVETWLARTHHKNPGGKIFLGIDSVTGFLVEDEAVAGLTGANMRTNSALSMFLSRLLRRWIALAMNYSAMIVFINQLRTRPGVVYGNPEYTTGGNSLRFYCAVRASVRRVKGGKLLQAGKVVGLKGAITNLKNKTGEGSLEAATCGFKSYYHKQSWKFTSAEKIRSEDTDVMEE